MTTYELVLPYTAPPLSLNDRGHWAARKRKADDLRDAVILLARAHRIPRCDRIAVTLHWRPANKRRRDADNPVATYKVAVDALVKAGCVLDDAPRFVTGSLTEIHDPIPGQPGRVWLEVVDLTERPAA